MRYSFRMARTLRSFKVERILVVRDHSLFADKLLAAHQDVYVEIRDMDGRRVATVQATRESAGIMLRGTAVSKQDARTLKLKTTGLSGSWTEDGKLLGVQMVNLPGFPVTH